MLANVFGHWGQEDGSSTIMDGISAISTMVDEQPLGSC